MQPSGFPEIESGAVGTVSEELGLGQRAASCRGRIASCRVFDTAQQIVRDAFVFRYGVERGEESEASSDQGVVVQFVGHFERHRAVAAGARQVTHPQGRCRHAEQGLRRLARGLRPDEQIAGIPVVSVSPHKVQLVAVDIADAQVEQSEVIGLIDGAEPLLDLEEQPQGPGFVPSPQVAATLVEAGFAESADFVRMLFVIRPGDAQQRIVVRVEPGAFRGFGAKQRIVGPLGAVA